MDAIEAGMHAIAGELLPLATTSDELAFNAGCKPLDPELPNCPYPGIRLPSNASRSLGRRRLITIGSTDDLQQLRRNRQALSASTGTVDDSPHPTEEDELPVRKANSPQQLYPRLLMSFQDVVSFRLHLISPLVLNSLTYLYPRCSHICSLTFRSCPRRSGRSSS